MSLPRMSWHIGDYKKDTGHLRAAGHGAYFLLSMHYWATGSLPDDDKQLAAIACMTDREWKAHRDTLRAFFKGDGVWRHKRIDKEMLDAQAKYEKRVEAGKKGGKAKAAGKQCSSIARAEPYQPITDNPKEDKMQPPAALAPDADLYRRGREVLGKEAGGLVKRLLKSKDGNIALARAAIEQASTKSDPREYIGGILRGASQTQDSFLDPQAGIL